MKKNQQTILAVDATGEALTVALAANGRVYSARRSGRAMHDEALLPAAEGLLKRAKISWKDLDAVAAASGPGRFTGIRVGLAFAATAGFVLKIPALAISRLEAAAAAAGLDDVVAALPGWKGEVYHQRFKKMKPAGKAEWTAPADWPAKEEASRKRGVPVLYGDVGADELLIAAGRRLASKRFPPFEPFYLKPAGYERPRR